VPANRHAFLVALLQTLLYLNCGSIGEPLPPLLNIPESTQDLDARQVNEEIILHWTWPETTTEGMPLSDLARFAVHFMPAGSSNQRSPSDFSIQSKWLRDVDVADLNDQGPGDPVQVTLDAKPFLRETIVLGVRAESRRGRSVGFSNLLVLQVLPPPEAPAPPQLTVTPDAIELAWGAVPDARSYRIERRAGTDTEFGPIATTTENTFRDSQFAWDETYRYRVQSLTGASDYEIVGGTSEPVEITAHDTFPPATPTGLRVVAGLNSIELSWEPGPEPDLASYRLLRTADSAEPVLLEINPITSINYNDKQVERGVTYRYYLTALDQDNNESPATKSRPARLP
jgi:hypothetical protein